MKFYARTQPLSQHPILEALSIIRRLGFDGVEVCLENPELRPENLTAAVAERVRSALMQPSESGGPGFTSWSVSLHVNYIYDDAAFAQTLQAIAWTPAFGADTFVFSGTARRTGDEAEWQLMLTRTAAMLRMAEEHGVTLAEEFEPNFIVGCTEDLLRLFEALPSPHLAANMDLGHVFLCDLDPLQALRSVGDKIVHGHIENMQRGVHRHLPPQEGDMDLRAYLQVLAEIGFEGGLALDLYQQDYEAAAAAALPYLRALGEQAIAH